MAARIRRKAKMPKQAAPTPPNHGAGVKGPQEPTVPKKALDSATAAGKLYGGFPPGGTSARPREAVRPTK